MKPRILIVEPDRVVGENICKYLRRHGYQADWSASAQSAIMAADKNPPAAIVLDLQLGRHSGVEFLHELRSYSDWQNIPVVIYSTLHPDELGGEGPALKSLTAQAYLHKPATSLSELAQKLDELVTA